MICANFEPRGKVVYNFLCGRIFHIIFEIRAVSGADTVHVSLEAQKPCALNRKFIIIVLI